MQWLSYAYTHFVSKEGKRYVKGLEGERRVYMKAAEEFAVAAQLDEDHFVEAEADQVEGFAGFAGGGHGVWFGVVIATVEGERS